MEEEQRNQMTTDNLKTQFVNSLTAASGVIAGFNKDKKLEYFDRLEYLKYQRNYSRSQS